MRGCLSTVFNRAVVTRLLVACALVAVVCLPALAQQTDINRYTLYTGFDYMTSPARDLTQRGFDTDFGFTAKPWLGLGVDFSASGNDIISGGGTINGSGTVYAPALTAANQVNPLIPLPSSIFVPFKSTTYTVAVGPQIYIRHWKAVTFLARPGFGAIHEAAGLTLPPPVIPLFQMLKLTPPSAHPTDTTWFVGLGGGFDLNLSRRVGLRFTADWINTHLFSNLLVNRQNYGRYTVGPVWRWGHLE